MCYFVQRVSLSTRDSDIIVKYIYRQTPNVVAAELSSFSVNLHFFLLKQLEANISLLIKVMLNNHLPLLGRGSQNRNLLMSYGVIGCILLLASVEWGLPLRDPLIYTCVISIVATLSFLYLICCTFSPTTYFL